MANIGFSELLVVLAIVLVVFGAKRLPELASGMGKSIRNFKRAIEENDDIAVTPVNKQVAERSAVPEVTPSRPAEPANRKA